MAGKGDNVRPRQIPRDAWDKNFDDIDWEEGASAEDEEEDFESEVLKELNRQHKEHRPSKGQQ